MTSICEGAFYNCSGLTSVTIPNSVQTIGWMAFFDCTSLMSINVDSGNLNYASSNGVLFNKNYVELIQCPTGKTGNYDIPNSVQTIGEYAFHGCGGLTSVTISSSVQTIGQGAFFGCQGAASVTIPNSVQIIGEWAFAWCDGLTSVYYLAEEPISSDSDCFSNITYSNATLYVPEVAVEKCKEIDPWKNFNDISGIAGIEEITIDADENMPCEVYTLNGVKVGDSTDNLPAGLYIIRQGKSVKKITVK